MAASDPPTAPLPESIGRYRIVRLLGEGAMGRVLLAHDPVLDREVAVKHLRADLNIPDDVRRGLVKRMRHEARAAARVMHPHLVTLHDMGEDDRVGLYLVFEYVAGPTLKERVVAGRLPPKEAARTAVELGTALTTAHDAGILHRDIKPENVILSKKGAKIADFGIARIPDSTLTHQGGLMGTPAYSAPETFRTSTFSPESDQFSLAATVYEATSGKRAFPGDDAVAVAQRILHETVEPFAASLHLSAEVDHVFARALSRRPRERFSSCEAFGRALSDALLAPSGAPGAGPGPASEPGSATRSAAGPAARSDTSSATRSDTGSAARSDTGSAARSSGGSATRSGAGSEGDATMSRTGGLRTSSTRAESSPVTAEGLPRERRGNHILLGVIAVVVTGLLLLRTALKPADAPPPALPASAVAPAAPAASSSAPRPKVAPVKPARTSSTSTPPTGDAGPPAPGDPTASPADSGGPPGAPAISSSEPASGNGPTVSEPPATSSSSSGTAAPSTTPSSAPPAKSPDAGR